MSATARYAGAVSTKVTPQSQPIIGKTMVKNAAGGFVFQIDDFQRLERFLILGTEKGTFYTTERALTVENAQCVLRCAQADLNRTIETIRQISLSGRAPKNDPAIFAIALLAGQKGETGKAALSILNDVCRTATHLFQFHDSVKAFRGRGPTVKRAFQNWYQSKTPSSLAYQVTKYQQREGVSHRDLLRLFKPVPRNGVEGTIFRWAVGKPIEAICTNEDLRLIYAFEEAKRATSAKAIVNLIETHGLVREHIPTQFLNDPTVWEALLQKMPVTAMLRNLSKMTTIGLIRPFSEASTLIAERLRNLDILKGGRIHPLNVLTTKCVYDSGRGVRGSLIWTPDQQVSAALEDAFMLSFEAFEPTNKRYFLGVDVSGSMTYGSVAGSPMTPNMGAAALAMLAARCEPRAYIMGFASQSVDLGINARTSLTDAVQKCRRGWGSTNAAAPMEYALQNNIEVDVFEIITDNETWSGRIHPCQALEQYRQKTGIPAKLVAVGLTATRSTIGDVDDPNSLAVVGFDSSAPSVIADFCRN